MDRKSEIKSIRLDELKVDHSYQRPPNDRQIKSIADNPMRDAFGIPPVSQRANGDYFIIDGQHRVAGLKLCGWGHHTMKFLVHYGLTQAEEAALFYHYNDKRNVDALSKFRARYTAEDPIAIEVHDLVTSYGWSIEGRKADGIIAAIDSLERVYLIDPKAADLALYVITTAWDREQNSVDAPMIKGMSLLLRHYTDVDLDSLIEKLRKYPGGAAALISQAKHLRKLYPQYIERAMVEVLVAEYNKGKRVNKLPDFRSSKS